MTEKDNNSSKQDKSSTPADKNSPQPAAEPSKPKTAAELTKIAAQAKQASVQSGGKSSKPADKLSSNQSSTSKSGNSEPSSAPVKTKPTKAKANTMTQQSKRSKTAIFAFLLGVFAIFAIAVLFWWQQQQNSALEQRLTANSKAQIEQANQALAKALQQNSNRINQQLAQTTVDISQSRNEALQNLQASVTQLLEEKPNNWQVQEAEYLTRMAGRILWLEKDAATAIALIMDADDRLNSVKDPRLLPVRELLHQDIEQLKLLPKLNTEQIILSLMGLAKQANSLELASVKLPESLDQPSNAQLSENVADWRENIAKTWQQFKQEFIEVRRRSGQVDALLAPEFQQNLYHNLQLKLQQTQWAASQGESKLYQQSISDIQDWLVTHFKTDTAIYEQFSTRLQELKAMAVTVDYPQSLKSQSALIELLQPSQRELQFPSLQEQVAPDTEPELELEKQPVEPENPEQNTNSGGNA